MTKVEKELVKVITGRMRMKDLKDCNPQDLYFVKKRSNRDFIGEVQIGHEFYSARGVDSRTVIKNLIKEIR